MKKLFVVFLAVGLLFGCTNDQSVKEPTNNASENTEKEEQTEVVTVIITKNNGEEVIEQKEIEINGEAIVTVMDVMQENFEIETQYDGAFISSINGLAGNDEEKTSWFYSVNGEEAMVGANEYELKSDDKVEFDLHAWE